MAAEGGKPVKMGARVEVIGKGVIGTVAYIGTTLFSSGKWIGVALDDAKGKNNGTVQGKRYFVCEENHGIFVRQSQLQALDEGDGSSVAGDDAGDVEVEDVPQSEVTAAQEPSPALAVVSTAQAPPTSGPVPATQNLPPRTPSVEDIAKKKQQNRLSASGLRAPTVGKSVEPATSSLPTAATVKAKEKTPSPVKETAPSVAVEEPPRTAAPQPRPVSATEATKVPSRGATQQPPHQLTHEEKTLATKPLNTGSSIGHAQVTTADITAMSTSISAQIDSIHQQQEIDGLKAEVKDLQEKLDTLKVKRTQDAVKLKEFEKVKIQLQQLQEYKTKMQETQMDLQKQLQAAKKEVSDVQEAFERYKEEMADVSESIELATLDKEMAEEKYDALVAENEQLKEKVEELSVDLQIMKEEITAAGGAEGAATTYQAKQLEQQNERMKEALVKLRELSNFEKQENQRLQKQIDVQKSEMTSLVKDREKLQKDVSQLQAEIIELKEQVDAAQGAEEMVEHLTEKTLQQEERLQQLEEEKNDLEALCDMNDQLQETAREVELQLREDLDMANARAADADRKLEAFKESIADYESTINKFREHVARQQEVIRELKSGSESKSVDVTPTIEFDFKSKFAETKAASKAIELELQKIESAQSKRHVQLLSAFLPESFLRRGGDNDAILVLLLIPRLMAKCELLMTQVREKFEVPDVIQREDVIQTHRSEVYGFANSFTHSLCILHGILKQFDSALNVCSVELLLKIGTLLLEMVNYEKTLDNFIEMLRRDELDNTTSTEGLEKVTIYFRQLYNVFLALEKPDCTALMAHHTRTLLAASNCLALDISALKLAMQPGQEVADTTILLRDVYDLANEVKVASRKVKRRIPTLDGATGAAPLCFGVEVQMQMEESVAGFAKVVKVFRLIASASVQLLSTVTDKLGLSAAQMDKLAQKATEKVFGKADAQQFDLLRQSCKEVCKVMKQIASAMENGEYDFDGTPQKQSPAPIDVRALAVKAEFADIDNLKNQLVSKDEAIMELKRLIKAKQDEFGEQQIRIGMMDKRLENMTKESDDRIDKIQQKLDDANITLKRKEKEHEEAMDALQADIDALEREKTELRDRVKELSRKSLMEGIVRQSTSAGSAAAAGAGITSSPMSSASARDTLMLQQQIDSLREALEVTLSENRNLLGTKMLEQVASLPSLKVPKKNIPADDPVNAEIMKLSKATSSMLSELYKECASVKVIDLSKRKPGVMPDGDARPRVQLAKQTARLSSIRRSVTELQGQVTTLMAARRPGGQIRTDFTTFPTPAFARMLHEKAASPDGRCVGVVRIPVTAGKGGEVIPLHVSLNQLNQIHSYFLH
jgi:dynactin 1